MADGVGDLGAVVAADEAGAAGVGSADGVQDVRSAGASMRMGVCGSGERTVVLPRGAVFTVPRGVFHKPSSALGAETLLFEPTGTVTVGDRHDEVPDHVDAATGHELS